MPPTWTDLRHILADACGVFGHPSEIALAHTLDRKTRDLISSWLTALEHLVRRMLILAALELPEPKPRAARTSTRKSKVAARQDEPLSEDSAEWRVAFPLGAPASTRATSKRRAHGAFARRYFSAAPYALRLEALIRVALAPEPYAKRLAACLAKDRKLAARISLSGNRRNPRFRAEINAAADWIWDHAPPGRRNTS